MKRAILITISTALFAFPAWAQKEPGPGPAPAPDARLDAEQVLDRLNARLSQLDEQRARITEMISRIKAGQPPRDALGPMGIRLLQQRKGDRPVDERGPRPNPGRPGDISVEEVRAFIDEHLPELSARIAESEAIDPEQAGRMIRRITPRLASIIREKDADPEFARLRLAEMRVGMEILLKSRRLHRVSMSDKPEPGAEKIEQEIRDLLGRQFDLRAEIENHRLKRMAAELESAKIKLANQAEHRDEVIEDHLARVLERTKKSPGEKRGPSPGPKKQNPG